MTYLPLIFTNATRMKLTTIWKLFVVMAIFTVAMVVNIMLDVFFNVPYTKYIGFGCIIVAMAVLLILVVKMRRFFSGDLSGSPGFEKTWTSYPKS